MSQACTLQISAQLFTASSAVSQNIHQVRMSDNKEAFLIYFQLRLTVPLQKQIKTERKMYDENVKIHKLQKRLTFFFLVDMKTDIIFCFVQSE